MNPYENLAAGDIDELIDYDDDDERTRRKRRRIVGRR
jgi:hypothetical protein